MNIRVLTQEDWQTWKALRLEALQNSPQSFRASFEEEANGTEQELKLTLTQNTIFGAFDKTQLIGIVGFYILENLKTKHRGLLWGLYVKPEYRKQGVASNLIDVLITYAKLHLSQLHLSCATENHNAIKIYQLHGFKIYGTEPRALKVGDDFYDDYLMVLVFDDLATI